MSILSHSAPLTLFVDAGFRHANPQPPQQPNSPLRLAHEAGLGIWIPRLALGIAFAARAADNNEAEALAIALGALVGLILNVRNGIVVTDSKLNFERLLDSQNLENVQRVAKQSLEKSGFQLEWRARDSTLQADFFASLALEGRSFVVQTANAKNHEEKLRPLLHASRTDKTPLKNLQVKWLSLPSAPKNPPRPLHGGVPLLSPQFENLIGSHFPATEFHFLVEFFLARARAGKTVS